MDFSQMTMQQLNAYAINFYQDFNQHVVESLQQPGPEHLFVEHYYDLLENLPDNWYRKFAQLRINAKCGIPPGEQMYQNCTPEDAEFLRNNDELLNYFIDFLKSWRRLTTLVDIENKIIDSTRSDPEPEWPIGKPTISQDIRTQNKNFLKPLRTNHDTFYNPIENYLTHITETHNRIGFGEFIFQDGGKYRKKYLKYKSKYSNLKMKMRFANKKT